MNEAKNNTDNRLSYSKQADKMSLVAYSDFNPLTDLPILLTGKYRRVF